MPESPKFITKDFATGTTLFAQGEPGDFIYIIINGSVDISREVNGETEHVARVSSGEILGEMAILTDEPRCASAVTTSPTRVIMVKDRALRLALINNELPILKPLTSQLTLRFKEAEQQANYYRRKCRKLEKEMDALKQQLLHYTLAEDN